MKKSRVNSITYGAMMAALIGVLLFINRQFAGILDLYLFWIIPIPVIVYCVKFGLNRSLVLAAAIMGVALVVSTPVTLFYVAMSILAGIVYAWGVINDKNVLFLIGSVTLISLLIVILTEFVFASFFGFNLVEDIAVLQETIADLFGDNPTGQYLLDNPNLLRNLLIISTVITSCLEGVLIHLISFIVLKRLNMKTPKMVPLTSIHAGIVIKLFVFAVLISQFLIIITKATQFVDIITVLLILVLYICAFFGYLLVLTWLEWKRVPRKSRIIYILLYVVLVFVGPYFIIGLGCADIYTNLRNTMAKEIASNGR